METLLKDIRYGIRTLLKRPAFTAVAVITLALGIGASTAIFSVVDGVLLRSLPYPQAERIVQLREVNERGGQMALAEPDFLDVRDRSRTLETIAQYSGDLTTVTGGSEPVRAMTFAVSGNFFHVLGTQPLVGRAFAPEESKGGQAVAVISYGFWQRLLGGKADLTRTPLKILDKSFTVVGVMTSLLFGVTPTDTSTFVAVAVGLIAVALMSCYIPARRATKVDPLVALRYE